MSENAMTEGAETGLQEAESVASERGSDAPGDTVDNPSITPPPDPQDELDRLLNEAVPQPATIDTLLDEAVPQEPTPEAIPNGNDDAWAALAENEARLNEVANHLAFKEEEAARAAAVKVMREGLPFDEPTVKALIHGFTRTDPSIKAALQNRDSDPRAWTQKVGEMRSRLERAVESIPDQNATADREAALASARDPGKPVELTDADISNMTQAEFRDEMMKYGVKPYG